MCMEPETICHGRVIFRHYRHLSCTPGNLHGSKMAEPEDVKRLLCKHLSKASYNKNVADLIADTWQTQAVILQTWPALHEGEGFSAFTAMLPLGPVSALVVLFRGTKGTPEWLSYPEALATGELLRSMEGLTGFTPFVDTLEQVSLRRM